MKEPFIEKLRRFLRQPIPRRVNTSVAVWWDWAGHTFGLRRHDGRDHPPVSIGDLDDYPGQHEGPWT